EENLRSFVSGRISVEVAKAIPHSSLWIVHNSGHVPLNCESWPEFLKTLLRFDVMPRQPWPPVKADEPEWAATMRLNPSMEDGAHFELLASALAQTKFAASSVLPLPL